MQIANTVLASRL